MNGQDNDRPAAETAAAATLSSPPASPAPFRRDTVARWLHAGFGVAVYMQLLLSLSMETPLPGVPSSGVGQALFKMHEAVGLAIGAFMAIYWLWQLSGKANNGIRGLFPWITRNGRATLAAETRYFLTHRLDDGASRLRVLAGTVHGLGATVTTLMAITGAAMYLTMTPAGALSSLMEAVKHLHGYLAVLLWIYVIGHSPIGMAMR